MSIVSERFSSRRVPPCLRCHDWMFKHLSEVHAWNRMGPDDKFVYRVVLNLRTCPYHAESCIESLQRWMQVNFCCCCHTAETTTVYLTSTEVDVARKSSGAGLYTGAPATTCDANTHFATYRFGKRNGDPVSLAALDHLFGWLCAAISCGRVPANAEGMREIAPVLVPMQRQKSAKVPPEIKTTPSASEVEPSPSGGAHVAPPPGLSLIKDPNASPGDPNLAARVFPEVEQKVFWQNSIQNVQASIKGRIDDVEVPVTASAEDLEDLKAVAESIKKMLVADRKVVLRIIEAKLGLGWRSKKWNPTRAENALRQLQQTYAPRYKFSASIKLEPSKNQKPPRLLIADADRGQVMAWALIGTLEAWLFHRFKSRSIKGCSKDEAMTRVIKELRQMNPLKPSQEAPCAILENDGSAWDACMSARLRSIVENPIMEAIAEMVSEYYLPEAPPDFVEARLASNELRELNLEFTKLKATADAAEIEFRKGRTCWKTQIRAIRRSGCRGTSVLNFLANMIIWCWAIGGKDGANLVMPNNQRVKCVDGMTRWVKMAFEGDDSILSLQLPGATSDECVTERFMHLVEQRWTSVGHRPKLFWRKPGEIAEFTGWHFEVTSEGLGDCCPDLWRQLAGMSYSTSKDVVKAVEAGDIHRVKRLVAPGVLARLFPLASRLPVLSRILYGAIAGGVDEDMQLTRDEVYLADIAPADLGFAEYSDKDYDLMLYAQSQRYGDITSRFELALAEGEKKDPTAEADLMVKLKVVDSIDSYYDLLDAVQAGFRIGGDSELFKATVDEIRARNSEAAVQDAHAAAA